MSAGVYDDYDDGDDEDNYNLKMCFVFLRTTKACDFSTSEPVGVFQHFLPLNLCLL
jgi:hypothetical protein